MSKVASYGKSVRLTFKCKYPYRQWQAHNKYKILPINDDDALNTVLRIGASFQAPNCLEVYIDKEVVHNILNMTQMDSRPFTTLLTHGIDTTAFQSPMYESDQCYPLDYTQQSFEGHGVESSSHGGYDYEFDNNTQDVPTCSHHTTPVEVAGNMAETVNNVQFAGSDMYGPDVALNDDDNEMCDEESLLGRSDDDDDEEDDAEAPVDPENAPIPPRVKIPFYDNIHMGGDFDISTRDVVPHNRIWSAENPELDRGMVFVDKKQLVHAVKLYHATNN